MPESARSYPAAPLAGALLGQVGHRRQGPRRARVPVRLAPHRQAGRARRRAGPAGPRHPQHPAHARRRAPRLRHRAHVDENVQWETEHALLDQVQATGAAGGMAAVVDVTNGDVLAIASVDGATAEGSSRPRASRRPASTTRRSPSCSRPGSTTKLITLSWAIEHGHVTPDTMFTVPYSIKVDPDVEPFYDAEWHETDAVDDGRHPARVVERRHDRDRAAHAQRRARRRACARSGSATRPRSTGPVSRKGSCCRPSQYYATGKYSTAIGYGAAVTGMQMLDAFATIANGGVTRPPHLLDATIDAHGMRHPAPAPNGARVVSAATAQTMTRDDGRRGRERHRRVRGDPRLPRRGQDRNVEEAPRRRQLLRRVDDGVVHRVRPGRPSALRGDRRARLAARRSSSSAARRPRRCGRR